MKQLSFESSGKILRTTEFVVIDCETTGVSSTDSAITEIAAVTICEGEKTGSFHTLVNPGVKLSEHIIRLTAITNEDLVDAPSIDQVLASLLEFIGNKIIIGHNVKFDLAFINAALTKHHYQALNNAYIDTLTIARKLYANEVRNFKLSTLAQYIKTNNLPTHRAYSDVLATIDLFHNLVERSSSLGVSGVNDFIKIPSKKNRSRYSKRTIAKDAPSSSGIYIFTNKDGKALYIGKSRNIKERLRSYFVSDDRAKISKLIHNAVNIEYITTPSSYEARILELRALAMYKPEYNHADINISRYTYLSLDVKEEIPTLRLAKYVNKSIDTLLYGPFTSKSAAIEFRNALNYLFGLRNCENNLSIDTAKPIATCMSALQGFHSCFCFGDLSDRENYLKRLDAMRIDLPRNFNLYTARLLDDMNKQSKELRFEKAKIFYDFSVSLQKWMNRFSSIHSASALTIKNSINSCDVIEGRAIVRMDAQSNHLCANEIMLNMEIINNDIFQKKTNSICTFGFISNPNEFKERLTLAHYLERLNLVYR